MPPNHLSISINFTDTVYEMLFENHSSCVIIIADEELIRLCCRKRRQQMQQMFKLFLDYAFQVVKGRVEKSITDYFPAHVINDYNDVDDNYMSENNSNDDSMNDGSNNEDA